MSPATRDAEQLASRLAGAVWGHLVGDAVGVPYEFQPPSRIKTVVFGATGSHNQPAGTWSDDGALTLALLDSILSVGFNTADQGKRALAWYRDRAYTPDGDRWFDIGGATRAALDSIARGTEAEWAGGRDDEVAGNGSLMRILPLALVERDVSDAVVIEHAHRASRVTHGSHHALVACALYVLIARRLLAGRHRPQALDDARRVLRSTYNAMADGQSFLGALDHLEGWTERAGRGRVWDSFWSAWDAFAGASSYRETIERAVHYGTDTDTTAAIAGGLAGIRWGVDGIPDEWLAAMRGRDIAAPLIDRLIATAGWQTSTDNPIRVNWVDLAKVGKFRHWPGRLGMTFLPGKQRDGQSGLHWRDLEADGVRLRDAHGVETLFLLVEDDELDIAHVPNIVETLAKIGIDVIRYPIADTKVPGDRTSFREALDDIEARLRAGQFVAVACRGGLGRTGTVVACILRDGGLAGDAAITMTREARHKTIERPRQEAFIRGWDWPDRPLANPQPAEPALATATATERDVAESIGLVPGADVESAAMPEDVQLFAPEGDGSGQGEPAVEAEATVPVFGQPIQKARRRTRTAKSAQPVDEDKVGDYRHEDATRTNIPEAGLATQDRSVPERVTYAYDPHLDPQLVWAGKAEHESFDVDTVSLHIHERVSTAAVLRAVRREDVQRTLFSDPEFSLDQEIAFYQHEMDWANRLILGNSLHVMNSLLRREGMAGKIQCIYIDPPYGVNYNSNFQSRIDERDVREDDRSLSREPEMIRAYRDTWQLGIHSYLTYLRDRLLLARELLTESGSVFVQISDENVHHVRELLDEVFGADNFAGIIAFRKTAGLSSPVARTNRVASVLDYIIWYAKDSSQMKYRQLYQDKQASVEGDPNWAWAEMNDGSRRRLTSEERSDWSRLPEGVRVFRLDNMTSTGFSQALSAPYEFEGRRYGLSRNLHWKTTKSGLDALARARRLSPVGNSLAYVRYFEDFPVTPRNNVWLDTATGGFGDQKLYVVQTTAKTIARCVLMTTDPGDLVLDPTCGSGTTAFVAEQWGRRWITCDTSRVAMALARQRLMTASFEFYQLADADRGVDGGFRYRTVPHVTLRSIAQNERPEAETLYDQPLIDRSKARVSGPFTVEQVPAYGIDLDDPDAYDPSVLAEDDRADDIRHRGEADPVRSIGELVDLLRTDGVQLPGGRRIDFVTLSPTTAGGQIHAEGEFEEAGERRRIAVSFGPLYGPIGARQVEDVLREAAFAPYHAILFAGFAIDGSAQQLVQNYRTPKGLSLLMANIAADVLVPDLLKNRRGQQLFAVFGEPDIEVRSVGADEFEVRVEGMDVYDPATGEVSSDSVDQIAAWFLDQDYDRRSFLISQAFFPGAGTSDPWERLSRALKGWVDPDAFAMLRGTTSLPFRAGEQRRIAVKVIDFRGNEAIRIAELP
ncbi:MAG TPA: ADP-ribosylglycohydrolase family protein [Candidatus Limnocylindrales bacterium]